MNEIMAIKEQQSSGFGRVAQPAKMIPTCEEEADILLLFSVLILSQLVLFQVY